MNLRFRDQELAQLATDRNFTGGLSPAIVKGFRKVIGLIRAAANERDFFAMRSLKFERLSGARKHQHSLRINDQYRLIIEFDGQGAEKTVHIIRIEDYH